MNKLSKLILMLPLALAPLAGQAAPKGGSHAALAAGFVAPPDSVQTSVYWYWLSGNVSKEGVVKDLEAMKRAGINRAFIGNIGLGELATPYAPVKLFTDEWWGVTHAALKRASELGIEIGMFNSPGWSQAGGPWIEPGQACVTWLRSRRMSGAAGRSRRSCRARRPISRTCGWSPIPLPPWGVRR